MSIMLSSLEWETFPPSNVFKFHQLFLHLAFVQMTIDVMRKVHDVTGASAENGICFLDHLACCVY